MVAVADFHHLNIIWSAHRIFGRISHSAVYLYFILKIVIEKIVKNKSAYRLFKKIARAVHFFQGLAILKEAARLKPKSVFVSELPQELENFEDLSWLFFSNFINGGIIRMCFNEAAYVFKTARKNQPRCLLEIGRYEGGSTMLISVAKSKEAKFISLDIEDKCHETIKKSLDKNTSLIIGDSKKFIPPCKIDYIFIDGDHSFEGVRADFEHYFPYLNDGADILFHDAVRSEKYILAELAVNYFVKTLEASPGLKFIKDVGSIRHFKKIT